MGLMFFPITSCIFNKFHDNGWMFSKILGISISGILIWLLSYMKILKFTVVNCYIIIGILLIINIIVFIKNKNKFKLDSKKITNILITEILFLIVFMCWVSIKSYTVRIDNSTEQFMDYGFMNAIMNSSYMPVEDIWLSGNHINYYYFGQYISAFLTKISFLQINEGYNIMLALVATFTFILPYAIACNIGKILIKEELKTWKKVIPYVIAIITGISMCIGGTLHFPIYKWIVQDSEEPYNFLHAIRYIGYRPETNDKTITDIPAYSNVVKDLHAHYVDIIFVFTTLALLLQLLMSDKKETTKHRLTCPIILLLGIILGIQKMTNYWDFPIYLVVISAMIIANTILKYKLSIKNILIGIGQILEVLLIEELITLPFTLDLYISATKVHFTNVGSPLYKLCVLWGFPILCVVLNLGIIIIKLIKNRKTKLIENIRNMKISDIYIIIIGLCAIGLVILPEIVYLKDIYGDEFKRANTMFKLTYQAYILFTISSSYIIIKLLYEKGNIIKKIIAGILLVIYVSTFGYGLDAISVIKTYN